MTLAWLDAQRIRYEREGWSRFVVKGGQRYSAFERSIPGDFSSATFFLCAAAVTGSELYVGGLDKNDVQGDRAVVNMLREMGMRVEWEGNALHVHGGSLKGVDLDLNDTPDALPALAVVACFAQGKTVLRNVAQARIKETDRISVMTGELRKMGGCVEERDDGLVIEGRPLTGCTVSGHGDHRIVMALAVAGLGARRRTVIDTAESVRITFPDFVSLMRGCGASIQAETDDG
jgi:3-phosphoshikimate 1-carboxyvinyltransferase